MGVLLLTAQLNANEQIFTKIYATNYWGHWNDPTVSGSGSTVQVTQELRKYLEAVFTKYGIKKILDAPCGDFNWMRLVDLSDRVYFGYDIVKDLIAKNNCHYRSSNKLFIHGDVRNCFLPKVDVIICRDLFIHFPSKDIKETIKNFKKSGSTYLLTTTFTRNKNVNGEIAMGGWRLVNLFLPPFNFPKPLELINEHSTEVSPQYGAHNDKCIALWRLADLYAD